MAVGSASEIGGATRDTPRMTDVGTATPEAQLDQLTKDCPETVALRILLAEAAQRRLMDSALLGQCMTFIDRAERREIAAEEEGDDGTLY
ncbi:MAG: hypothetical protein ABIG34_02370 [Candidatus Peregrinibacteria bacterium]